MENNLKTTKNRVLAGREVVDEYIVGHSQLHLMAKHGTFTGDVSKAHTPLLNTLLSELKKLGFNSQEEFFQANKQLCYEELRRCFELTGTCDGCEGKEKGCIEKCYLDRTEAVGNERTPVKGDWSDFYEWQHFENNTPPGCSMKFERISELSFDIFWGMSEGVKPEVLKRAKGKNGS